MVPDKPPLTLTIPSDLHHVAIVRDFIEAVCQAAGVQQAVIDAIVLAAHEAASNAIRHAHQDRPQAYVQVQCYLWADGIEIRLLDEGKPFNLDAVPPLDPSELRVGGRGVFLMRSLMDELSCQPRGERGNTLRMVKRWQAPCPAPRAG